MRLIDADEAVRILDSMKRAREKNCSRSAITEARAFAYAIEIINKLPEIQQEGQKE